MKPRYPLMLTLLCLLGISVRAQTTQIPVSAVGNQLSALNVVSHSTPELIHIRELFRRGLYQELIKSATEALGKGDADKPSPELLYWRGFAFRRCGLFDAAQTDLRLLGNMAGGARCVSAAQLSTELALLLEQRPPLQKEICAGDKVLFRVYYSEDDEFLKTVVEALPKGYAAASSFVGGQSEEIPVFVFNSAHYPEFVKFFTTFSGGPLQGWWRMGSRDGTITVSQKNASEAPLSANCPDMARLMSHEITHHLVHNLVGEVKDIPAWFNEGMARCGERGCEAELGVQNTRKIEQMVEQDTILPLRQLVSMGGFYYSVEQMKKGLPQGDAYAQGFSMTRHLEDLLEDRPLRSFLDMMQEKQSFQVALLNETGLTMGEFYESWLNSIGASNR